MNQSDWTRGLGTQNPLGMKPDSYAGDFFVLPETNCTDERKLFFRRMNEIQALLYITKLSFDSPQFQSGLHHAALAGIELSKNANLAAGPRPSPSLRQTLPLLPCSDLDIVFNVVVEPVLLGRRLFCFVLTQTRGQVR